MACVDNDHTLVLSFRRVGLGTELGSFRIGGSTWPAGPSHYPLPPHSSHCTSTLETTSRYLAGWFPTHFCLTASVSTVCATQSGSVLNGSRDSLTTPPCCPPCCAPGGLLVFYTAPSLPPLGLSHCLLTSKLLAGHSPSPMSHLSRVPLGSGHPSLFVHYFGLVSPCGMNCLNSSPLSACLLASCPVPCLDCKVAV